MAARFIAFLLLSFALLAGTVSGSPAGSDFTVSPASPTEGQEATFTFVPGPGIVGTPTVDWDIVGDEAFEVTDTTVATHTYADDGDKTVRMRVTDDEGSQVFPQMFSVNAAPSVDFSFSPTSPLPGASVSFSATGSDPDGDALTYAWTFGDGGTSNAEDPQHTYTSPGMRTVTVTVTDGRGGTDAVSRQITVQNRRPTVDFDFSPASPLPGQSVLFSPDVSDPDGDAVTLVWNFGSGSTQTGTNRATYADPGTRTVTLTATDSRGGSTTERRDVTIAAAPVRSAELRFITPFPIVRLAGKVLPHGARIQVLAVRAPRRAVIQVRCVGKGCPMGSVRRTSRGRTVRFPEFERRLRAGIRVKLFVRQQNRIGKYTSFLIRAGARPKRVDMCLFPTRRSPGRCP